MRKLILAAMLLAASSAIGYAQKPAIEHHDSYTTRGIRAFFDAGKTFGGDFGATLVSAAYGKQTSAQKFWGAGMMLEWGGDIAEFAVFGNFRYDFRDHKISPFLDARLGAYTDGDCAGMLLNPSIGIRYGHASLSAGWDSGISSQGYNSLQIRIGLDFGARVK